MRLHPTFIALSLIIALASCTARQDKNPDARPADAIYARTFALTQDGEPMHLLDAYFYHHTGNNALRCLALSNRVGVYEGDLTVLDGGALQLDLKGYEGDQVVPHDVRFDFGQDGILRHRVWSFKGTERTLRLDISGTADGGRP